MDRVASAPPSEASTGRRAPAAAVWATFLMLLALFSLTAPGAVNAVDVWPVIGEAAGLVEQGTVDYSRLDPEVVGADLAKCIQNARGGAPGPRNKYGFGLHTGFVPAYLAARLASVPLGVAPLDVVGFPVSFLNPLAGAAIGAMILAALFRLGFSARTCVGAMLLATAGTLLWPLTAISYTDPLQTAWLTAVFLQALRARSSGRSRDVHLLGLLALVACATKLSLAGLVVCLCCLAFPSAAAAWRGLRVLAGWGVAAAASAALVGWARYDDPLESGYEPAGLLATPLLDGLRLLLVSPSRGLIWFFPLLPAALFGWVVLWRTHRWAAAAIGAGTLLHVGFHARLQYVHGGYCLGPRYLLPLIPLAAPCLAAAAGALPRAIRTATVATALTLSAAWNLPMVTAHYFLLEPVWAAVRRAGGTARDEIVPLATARLLLQTSPLGPDRIELAPFATDPSLQGSVTFAAWDNSGWQWWWVKPHPSLPAVLRIAGAASLALLLAGAAVALRRSLRREGDAPDQPGLRAIATSD